MNMIDLNDLGWLVDQNIKEIEARLEAINKESTTAPQVAAIAMDGVVQSGVNVQENAPTASFAATVESMQRQQWFMEAMNPNEQENFGGDNQMMLPFEDQNPNNLWSSAFFPVGQNNR
ncbi:hypothetical protein L1049_019265 [Liquidambar formosana]|uniref:Uncharacterized protein n=1 Tax=Liquidambar formosana TaxID=63359 RepID=A0AAP0SBD4_LIQFO